MYRLARKISIQPYGFHFKHLKPNQSFDVNTEYKCIIQVDPGKYLDETFDVNLEHGRIYYGRS